MSAQTRKEHAIVLAKTKLKESDLIIRMINEDGSLVEAVAKGARKPSSTYSARLELLSEVEVLLALGKNLDIVKDVRLIAAHASVWSDPVRAAAASQIAEFTKKTVQRDLEVERLFDLVRTSIDAIESCDIAVIPAMVAAFLLKATSIMGFRPSLACCPICGATIQFEDEDIIRYSSLSGGAICNDCAVSTETIPVSSAVIQWSEALIRMRFSQIEESNIPFRLSLEVLDFADQWVETQLGVRLKSSNSLRVYLAEEVANADGMADRHK